MTIAFGVQVCRDSKTSALTNMLSPKESRLVNGSAPDSMDAAHNERADRRSGRPRLSARSGASSLWPESAFVPAISPRLLAMGSALWWCAHA